MQQEYASLIPSAQIEFDLFFIESVVTTEDSFAWWNKNKYRFPNLFKLSKKYLIVPVRSVPAERVFTKAGEIIINKRSRLSRERANELIFLNINKNLL